MTTGQTEQSQSTKFPAIMATQITDKVKLMEYISALKTIPCFFPHKGAVSHSLWDCGMSVTSKVEFLAENGRCRICWQEGHTASKCTVKELIDFKCNHCNATNHFKPMCYAYCTAMNNARKPIAPQQEPKTVSSQSIDMERYFSQLLSESAQRSREINAQTNNPNFLAPVTPALPEVTRIPTEIPPPSGQ